MGLPLPPHAYRSVFILLKALKDTGRKGELLISLALSLLPTIAFRAGDAEHRPELLWKTIGALVPRWARRACTDRRGGYHGPENGVDRLCKEGWEAPLDNVEMHVPLSRIQRLIATRMLASKQNKPCFYLETRADVTELMALRHALSRSLGVKITSSSFFVRALALAVQPYPLAVGRFVWQDPGDPAAGAVIQIAPTVNVGFAVNSPQGLVVPVIKDAAHRSLAEVAEEEKRLVARARSNRLTLEDIEGPTIALSNLGAYDIDTFLGIVPPPTSVILAAGKIAAAAVPREGHIVTRKLVSLSLAADHRVLDGAYAARFLRLLVEQLSSPERLM